MRRPGWVEERGSVAPEYFHGRFHSTSLRRKTSPGKVRGTADPSASLGMTKGGATLPWGGVAKQKVFFLTLGGRTGPHVHGMTKGRAALSSGFRSRRGSTADSHSTSLRRKTFPRKVRGTADPSASLPMNRFVSYANQAGCTWAGTRENPMDSACLRMYRSWRCCCCWSARAKTLSS